MQKLNPIHFVVLILLIAMLACSTSTPVVSPVQPIDLDTVIVQTANAAMTQTALVLPPAPLETFTLESTFTATETTTQTKTATLAFTSTPVIPMISVSVATNCRNGPGKVYDYQSALLIGTPVEIYARESSGNYWYIHNPETIEDQYCWIWGKYATIEGDTSALPIYTPPPTPTATMTSAATITPTTVPTKKPSPGSFVVSYNNTDTCNTNWWMDFKLRNNGTIAFQSMYINIKDMNSGAVFEKASGGFTDQAGCATLSEKDAVDPGDILIFSGPPFSYDPTGRMLRISLTLCTENGQKGTCIKQNFDVQL